MDSDKSSRSVFVGNIPYEATEEKLKEVFSEVGVVNSFKLVYDRENGKPKGYGFCEFKDAETALSAMRNLNGYEIGGRTLRVDSASTEKNKMEQLVGGGGGGGGGGRGGGVEIPPPQQLAMDVPPPGPGDMGPYGMSTEPEKAPEAISKAVASLPPEQMFELMKQMKACIQNNPQEARVMLNQNPQLAYALLQAQVVMRIIDPELAVNMLHKAPPKPPNFAMGQGPPPGAPPMVPGGGPPFGGGGPMMGQPMHGPPPHGPGMMPPMPMRPGMAEGPPAQAPFASGPGGFGRPDHPSGPPPDMRRDPREERFGGGRDPRDPRNRDPRGGGGGGMGRDPRDPRGGGGGPGAGGSGGRPGGGGSGLPPHLAGADPEKAQLIMQVLKLSDEQISMLPADQRASILELKKQINSVPPQ